MERSEDDFGGSRPSEGGELENARRGGRLIPRGRRDDTDEGSVGESSGREERVGRCFFVLPGGRTIMRRVEGRAREEEGRGRREFGCRGRWGRGPAFPVHWTPEFLFPVDEIFFKKIRELGSSGLGFDSAGGSRGARRIERGAVRIDAGGSMGLWTELHGGGPFREPVGATRDPAYKTSTPRAFRRPRVWCSPSSLVS